MTAAFPEFDPDFASPADWAGMYRLDGLQIVPAKMPVNGGQWKMPALTGWAEFQENLIPDAVFLRWYGQGGEHVARQNMGILTGRCSGNVFVLDLDVHKHPEAGEWWRGALAIHNSEIEPETVQQRTGGGGRQLLFRAPPDWVAPTNRTAIGVDIRGQGGFAMMPPSQHETGSFYAWETGCAPWEIEIAAAPEWLLEAINELISRHGSRPKGVKTVTPGTEKDAFGRVVDGREHFMRDVVWHAVLELYRASPIASPQHANSARDEAWAKYEREVVSRLEPRRDAQGRLQSNAELLELEHRGYSAFCNKWRGTIKKWGNPEFVEAANRPKPEPEPDKSGPVNSGISGPNVYEYLTVDQILDMPDPVWMIDGLINERALGFIFGPPSSLKTFMALDIALSCAAKLPQWWDRNINQHGAVIYLCREGTESLKFRIRAWELHRKAVARGQPFFLIRKTINFMKPEDVQTLVNTVEAIKAKCGVPIAAVFVDTVSRVLPGAKENQQEDMSLFVLACEIVQQQFQCIVVGVHHTNRNGEFRGSTVIPAAGDFLIEARREVGDMHGSIVLQKVKDGEDGQELLFKVIEVPLGDIAGNSSLIVDPKGETKAQAQAAGDDLPDIAVCREILGQLAQAWFMKMPWSHAHNSKRPAVNMIAGRWQLKKTVAKRLLELWLANGVVEIEEYDKRNKLFGYRKVTDL